MTAAGLVAAVPATSLLAQPAASVVVRPDQHVGWRCSSTHPKLQAPLEGALRYILGRSAMLKHRESEARPVMAAGAVR